MTDETGESEWNEREDKKNHRQWEVNCDQLKINSIYDEKKAEQTIQRGDGTTVCYYLFSTDNSNWSLLFPHIIL